MTEEFTHDIYNKVFPKNNIINDQEINQLRKAGKIVSFKKKDVIFRQRTLTSHAMFQISGLVKLFKEGKNGRSFILKISTAGYFLGLASIFGASSFQYTATAVEDCEIYFIDINTFKTVLNNNGKYATYLFSEICNDNLNVFNRITSQYQKQLPGKIADIILYFSEQIYNSNIFEFPLTRIELAELAGTTKESFIRTLTEFKNDKIIVLDGKSVEIKSIEIVKTLSRIG